MNKLPTTLAGLASLAFSPIASSHHGFPAHFDPDRLITIEGTVQRFDLVNPHGFLYIDSVDDAGEPVVYVCELPGRTQLARMGVDHTLFTVGETIVVEGFPARRDPLGCDFGVGYFADGSSHTIRSTENARTQFGGNREIPFTPGSSRSIFGTWIKAGASGRGPRTGEDSITPAGIAARDAFDPIADNPSLRCEATSPSESWTPPGLATSIRQVGNEILIYHESYDVTRTVHMNMDEYPADIEPSKMGHSIGRLENGTLIIDTAGFSAGVVRVGGSTLHTDQMTMVERLSIQEDTGRLLVSWVVNEPIYYSEPLTGSQILQSTDQEATSYDCIPGSPIE